MSALAVVFIVLMILALVGGGYSVYDSAGPYYNRAIGGSYILLWVCVAILGYLVLTGGGHGQLIH